MTKLTLITDALVVRSSFENKNRARRLLFLWPRSFSFCQLRSMARGLLHGIVAVTASAHSPVPPLLTVVPPPPLPPAPEDGGFSPLPRPPSTELGRALPSSQHDGRQLAHSTTIVGSVTSASVLDNVRAIRPCALTSDAAPRSHAPRACSPTCTAPHALSRVTCCAHSL